MNEDALLVDMPPRISELGNKVISEIAGRCGVEKKVVLRAMLLTSLTNQRELMKQIAALRGHEHELDEYPGDTHVITS